MIWRENDAPASIRRAVRSFSRRVWAIRSWYGREYEVAFAEKRSAFGRWVAWDFLRMRSRRLAHMVVRSYMDRLVNFSIYVNLGYMHCFSICHIVGKLAFFFWMA